MFTTNTRAQASTSRNQHQSTLQKFFDLQAKPFHTRSSDKAPSKAHGLSSNNFSSASSTNHLQNPSKQTLDQQPQTSYQQSLFSQLSSFSSLETSGCGVFKENWSLMKGGLGLLFNGDFNFNNQYDPEEDHAFRIPLRPISSVENCEATFSKNPYVTGIRSHRSGDLSGRSSPIHGKAGKAKSNGNKRAPNQASVSLNRGRKWLEEDCDDELAFNSPRKKTLCKSDNEAWELHFTIANNKVSYVNKNANPFACLEEPMEEVSLSKKNSMLCESLSIFGSQNSQSTLASSNGLLDQEIGSFEYEDTIVFADNLDSKIPLKRSTSLDSESETRGSYLVCEEWVDESNKISIKTRGEKCMDQFKILCENSGADLLEEQMKNWESNLNQPNLEETDDEQLYELHNIEQDYLPVAEKIRAQIEIGDYKRAELIDWLIEVSSDLRLKRETLYLAVNLADRYLSQVQDVPVWQYQEIGVTTLFIASKMEEFMPAKITLLAEATDKATTQERILKMETKICEVLNWRLNAPTLYTLADAYMTSWDKFASANHLAPEISFKQQSNESYQNFRELTQILDLLLLNTESLEHSPSTLAAALVYLVMGKAIGDISEEDLVQDGCAFQVQDEGFKEIFERFLSEQLGPSFESLNSVIEYVRPYFSVEISLKKPQVNPKYKITYSDFLSFQTHAEQNFPFMEKMFRAAEDLLQEELFY